MEENARRFFEESKRIMENNSNELLVPIKIEAEEEIVEATDTINCFIEKINSAMTYSANAIEQSKNASIKLEEITDDKKENVNSQKEPRAPFLVPKKSSRLGLLFFYGK